MSTILKRLPVLDTHPTATVGNDSIRLRPGQIVAWVSVSAKKVLDFDRRMPRFPVLIDTGSNHGLTLTADHLVRWAGIQPEFFRLLGYALVNRERVERREATVWLHFNRPGTWLEVLEREPFRLAAEHGIAVAQGSNPRIPLLGVQAFLDNELEFRLCGNTRVVTVKTPNHWWLF